MSPSQKHARTAGPSGLRLVIHRLYLRAWLRKVNPKPRHPLVGLITGGVVMLAGWAFFAYLFYFLVIS